MSYFPQGSVVKNPPTMQETQETPFPSLGWADPLENKMTTHSSILAWEIPWTEEPGRIQSMGSQKSRTRLKNNNRVSYYHQGGNTGHPRSPEIFLMPLPNLYFSPKVTTRITSIYRWHEIFRVEYIFLQKFSCLLQLFCFIAKATSCGFYGLCH